MVTPTVYEDVIRESLEAWARCVLKDHHDAHTALLEHGVAGNMATAQRRESARFFTERIPSGRKARERSDGWELEAREEAGWEPEMLWY
jgi:hypothetical protein